VGRTIKAIVALAALFVAFFSSPALAKKSVIVVVGAAGEEFKCDRLREANRKALLKELNGKFFKRKKVKKALVGVYSEPFEVVAELEANRNLPGSVRYQKLAKEVRKAVNRVYDYELPRFYSYATPEGKEVTYYRDVAGMLRRLADLIEEKGLVEKPKDRVLVFIASDMLQTLYLGSKEKTKEELLKNPIVFPGKKQVKIVIFGRAAECGNYSESQLYRLRRKLKNFWSKVIKNAEVEYRFNYGN